jgi:hypothetical protein
MGGLSWQVGLVGVWVGSITSGCLPKFVEPQPAINFAYFCPDQPGPARTDLDNMAMQTLFNPLVSTYVQQKSEDLAASW